MHSTSNQLRKANLFNNDKRYARHKPRTWPKKLEQTILGDDCSCISALRVSLLHTLRYVDCRLQHAHEDGRRTTRWASHPGFAWLEPFFSEVDISSGYPDPHSLRSRSFSIDHCNGNHNPSARHKNDDDQDRPCKASSTDD